MEEQLPAFQVAAQAGQALERALDEIHADADAAALIQELSAHAATRTVDVVPVKDDAACARRCHCPDGVRRAWPRPAGSQDLRGGGEDLAAAMLREGSALDECVLRATNPGSAVGEGQPELESSRRRPRRALVKRLKPFQAVDTSLSLEINQLSHPHWLNAATRGLTIAMKRADSIAVGLLLAASPMMPRRTPCNWKWSS